MMNGEHVVLYRKYRPRGFEEMVGQEHVILPLQNALISHRVAHAYLFSGPRGVGKTTMARLLAKALNCAGKERPCNSCAPCKDFNDGRSLAIIEIDAASNRGIDEIRELREGVRFIPTQGQYKTYVIDEVHMLTREAFNALLKTLEEPPAHAVFVLATTELEKVPATVVSRTQHYQFHRPTVAEIATRLHTIAKKESVRLEDDAAHVIALAAEGALRDAEGMLGQIMAVEDKKITRENAEHILGFPRREAVKKLFQAIAEKHTGQGLALIQELADGGHDLHYLGKLLTRYFRAALFLKTDPSLARFVAQEFLPDEQECLNAVLPSFTREDLSRGIDIISRNLQSFRKTSIPQLPLELSIVELTAKESEKN